METILCCGCWCLRCRCYFFFFFQAEDGIRDHCVTGVQTCALPISRRLRYLGARPAAARSRRTVDGLWRISVTKLRHLAIATDDPDATAQFYVDAFEFSRVSVINAAWGRGHVLTDGTISLSILGYAIDEAAGVEKGASFTGLHHIGFEVDDVAALADRIEAAG